VWNHDGLDLVLDECVETMAAWVWVGVSVWNYDGLGRGLGECVEI